VHRDAGTRDRRKLSAFLAAVIGPAAVIFTAAGDVQPLPGAYVAPPAVDPAPFSVEIVPAAPMAFSSAPSIVPPGVSPPPGEPTAASRWRVVEGHVQQLLPVGIASEAGLQVKTILVNRSISALFPEIQSIGGVRPDPLPWHPNGLALDVTIPNPGSPEGIALGDQIVAFVLQNARRFGLQDAIWRGVYYTPDGSQRYGYGHFDHVHITTIGGGYPTGGEIYVR
jgi:hypothetical protein